MTYAIIDEPILLGADHVITTFDPTIIVVGGYGYAGAYAATIEIDCE